MFQPRENEIDVQGLADIAGVCKQKMFNIAKRGLLFIPDPIRTEYTKKKKYQYWDKAVATEWARVTDCTIVLTKKNLAKLEPPKLDINVISNGTLAARFTDRTRPLILPGSIYTKYVKRRSTQRLEEFDPVPDLKSRFPYR